MSFQRNPDRKHYARKRILLDGLKNVPCKDCGLRFSPVCMDFDHVRGEKKKGVGNMLNHSIDLIMEEVAKCEVVCANCHRIRTQQRRKG